ncbi:MAG: hypothetical protein ABS79_01695 [Planctomycetes bacterium SCN 63-9]|nr:MAG: hypothetical protein ABS79_01695 [Planctomycetes bacterium SCN 63-9]
MSVAAEQAEIRAHFGTTDATTNHHALQIGNFLKAILDNRLPWSPGSTAAAWWRSFDAAYRSDRENRPNAIGVTRFIDDAPEASR